MNEHATDLTPAAESSDPGAVLHRVGNLAPLAIAATATGGALAYYMGWSYQRAYLEEWGLPPDAFSFNAYELMVASTSTIFFAFSFSILGFLYGLLTSSHSPFDIWQDPRPSTKGGRIATTIATIALSLAVALWALAGSWRGGGAGPLFAAWYALIFSMWSYWVGIRAGLRTARFLIFAPIIASAIFLVVFAPSELGAIDAHRDRSDTARFPLVEFALSRSIGAENEHVECGRLVTGPWRLLRTNNGSAWVTTDENRPARVVRINISDTQSMIVTTDRRQHSVGCVSLELAPVGERRSTANPGTPPTP